MAQDRAEWAPQGSRHRSPRSATSWLLGGLALVAACGGADLGGDSGRAPPEGPDGDVDIDGGVGLDSGSGADAAADAGASTDRDGDAESCRAIEAEATVVEHPVDIVLIVDSTGSMGSAVARIEAVINSDFCDVISAAGVDYRVILLASGVSVGDPLASSGLFHHHEVLLGSGDHYAFAPLLGAYGAWAPWLRDPSIKVFLHFTDSAGGHGERIEGWVGTFDEILYALGPEKFGSPEDSRLVYHAIVGVAENDPPLTPWGPEDPLVEAACSHGAFRDPPGPGLGFQGIARRTGGLRFPVCRFEDFDVVFRHIADDVIEVSAPPCEYLVPEPPPGEVLDLETVVVRWSRPGVETETFRQVEGPDGCGEDGFYISGDRVRLCPETCSRVEAGAEGRVTVAFGCDPEIH